MPRPGAQFLWLFQGLKYLPGGIASIVAVLVPKLIFIGLILLPFLDSRRRRKNPSETPKRRVSVALFACGGLLIAFLTAMAYISDARDPNARIMLAQQAEEEAAFRAEPFKPLVPRSSANSAPPTSDAGTSGPKVVTAETPPESYLKKCASCHGKLGQGAKSFPTLLGVSIKPRRTVEDIIGLLNDPVAYGLEPPMRSFATKLTDAEKREIAEWLMLLKK
jgi:mono/diheme cytochrome c family protein